MPPQAKKSTKIDIGLVEPFEQPWKAKCKYFPSKLGGRPSFLALDPVLGPDQLTCVHCGQMMRFIFQAYVPIETNPAAFHRTLFVFGCGRSGECANEVRVYRSQLARKNRFYSDAPPDYDRDDPEYDPAPENVSLCAVCGIQGPHRCGQCQAVSYCSKEHQVAHWKVGGHKEECGKESVDPKSYLNNYGRLVFKEESIILAGDSDTENSSSKFDDDDEDDDDQDVTETEMSKYQDFVKTQKPSLQNENLDPYAGAGGSSSSSALSKETDDPESEDQLVFNRFKSLTLDDEVFRYRMDWFEDPEDCEDILWISSKNRLQPRVESSTGYAVPNCPECGSERKFELQILPQMLNYLKEEDSSSGPKKQNPIAFDDHLDWGTILVFSCPKSCAKIQTKDDDEDSKPQLEYYQEYVYHQPVGH